MHVLTVFGVYCVVQSFWQVCTLTLHYLCFTVFFFKVFKANVGKKPATHHTTITRCLGTCLLQISVVENKLLVPDICFKQVKKKKKQPKREVVVNVYTCIKVLHKISDEV